MPAKHYCSPEERIGRLKGEVGRLIGSGPNEHNNLSFNEHKEHWDAVCAFCYNMGCSIDSLFKLMILSLAPRR